MQTSPLMVEDPVESRALYHAYPAMPAGPHGHAPAQDGVRISDCASGTPLQWDSLQAIYYSLELVPDLRRYLLQVWIFNRRH